MTIPPQAYFVERVGGNRVAVTVLVQPGQSAETYEPSPTQVGSLEATHLYVRAGMPFEDELVKKLAARAPGVRVIDLREGIPLLPMRGHREHTGGVGQGGREEPDPHIWLDPNLVKRQAQTIRDGLVAVDPAGRESYDRGLRAFQADLTRLDEEIRRTLAPVRGQTMFVFHPAFGYFADAYGLRQVPIEVEGKEPTPRQLAEVVREVRQSGARALFAQPQIAAPAVQAVAAEVGVEVVPLDPLARDYLNNLRTMAEHIARALEKPRPRVGSER